MLIFWLVLAAPAAAQGPIVVEYRDGGASIIAAGLDGENTIRGEGPKVFGVNAGAPLDPLSPFNSAGSIDDGDSWDHEPDGTIDGAFTYLLDTHLDTDAAVDDGALTVSADAHSDVHMTTSGDGRISASSGGTYIRYVFEVPPGLPAKFEVSGSTSRSISLAPAASQQSCGYQNNSYPVGVHVLRHDQPDEDLRFEHQTFFPTGTTGAKTVSGSGFLPPGTWNVLATTDAYGSRSGGNGQTTTCTSATDMLFTVTPSKDCMVAGIGVRVGNALACGPSLNPVEEGSPIYKTSDTAWVGGVELRPKPGGVLVVDTEAKTLAEEGTGVDAVIDGTPGTAARLPAAGPGGRRRDRLQRRRHRPGRDRRHPRQGLREADLDGRGRRSVVRDGGRGRESLLQPRAAQPAERAGLHRHHRGQVHRDDGQRQGVPAQHRRGQDREALSRSAVGLARADDEGRLPALRETLRWPELLERRRHV